MDSRLLATLAALAARYLVRVIAFSDAAPGTQQPFRQVTISGDRGADLAGVEVSDHAAVPAVSPGQYTVAMRGFGAPTSSTPR